MVLPFLTGQIPQIGKMLSPMHIPVLLCGFLCGPIFAGTIGFVSPLLRFLIFGMPPLFPEGLSMAFELLAYGVISGVLYKVLPNKPIHIYSSLLISMLLGRVVWGISRYVLASVNKEIFTFDMFLAGAFINGIPAIICHIIIVPLIVLALYKANLVPTKKH